MMIGLSEHLDTSLKAGGYATLLIKRLSATVRKS